MKKYLDKIKNKLKVIKDITIKDGRLSIRSKFTAMETAIHQLESFISVANTPFEVPKGYLWCESCQALTRHEESTYSWNRDCQVCFNSTNISGDCCDNCGWNSPDEIESPTHNVIIHNPGCHCDPKCFHYDDEEEYAIGFNNTHADQILDDFLSGFPHEFIYKDKRATLIKKRLREMNLLECSCPQETIYTVTNLYNYSCESVWSDSCSNAVEWSYDVRCPICGNVFQVCDGNC